MMMAAQAAAAVPPFPVQTDHHHRHDCGCERAPAEDPEDCYQPFIDVIGKQGETCGNHGKVIP